MKKEIIEGTEQGYVSYRSQIKQGVEEMQKQPIKLGIKEISEIRDAN